jgi:osmotically-inducible protein OsmY
LLQGMALSARVRAALRADAATGGVDVTIDSTDGHVNLRGIVADEAEKAAAARVAAGVAGVSSVDDQLRLMARSKLFPSARQ